MECLVCFRYAAPDRETGYDADGICPECAADGYYLTHTGDVARDERPFPAPPAPVADDDTDTECPF